MGNVRIVPTSGVAVTEVSDENAADFAETYELLAGMPVNNQAEQDFATAKEARQYVKEGKAWAASQKLTFARKGDVKGNPTRVAFRIYKPRPAKTAK